MKTFYFKLYKSKHNAKLHAQINAAGLTFNHCIALHKRYYKLFGKYLRKFTLTKHLTKLKRLKKFSYLKELDAQAVYDVVFRIDHAYNLFFNNLKRGVRCSPPKFKKVRCYKSFTLYQHSWKLDESNHAIIIRGQKYRYFQSRRINGKIKTVTVKRDGVGDIYVYFTTELKGQGSDLWKRHNKTSIIEAMPLTPQSDDKNRSESAKIIGFDFGLKKFLTASDGRDVISPLFFANNSKLIAKASRELSRKRKGSNNRRRARLKLARLYKKTTNQRHDFHFKLARRLCLEYDTICIEDLNVKAMQRLYGRKIGDLGFSDFVKILKYEATKFGTIVKEVGRYFASSQICHYCGKKNPKVKDLSVRQWQCPKCGAEHDRDRNAAINILQEGLGQRPLQETP